MMTWFVAAVIGLCAPPIAAAPANRAPDAGAVRVVVDTAETPDLAEWGKRAGETARTWHPKIAALLKSDGD
jgi:hypothetical protein